MSANDNNLEKKSRSLLIRLAKKESHQHCQQMEKRKEHTFFN